MHKIENGIEKISDFTWGFPMVVFLLLAGCYFTIRLKVLPVRYFLIIIKETIGKIFKKPSTSLPEGALTPFQAFSSSLAATAGATNIVGVPVAISLGGPGALFWMWVVALIGMSLLYAEIVLGLAYREKNKQDEWVGGPMSYMKKGLGWKGISVLYGVGLLLEIIPSCMVQANSVAEPIVKAFSFPSWWVGIATSIITALIVFGGMKRMGKVNEKLLPILVILYVITCLIVIGFYYDQIIPAFLLIFTHAFHPSAAIGTFTGASVVLAMRWGFARGLYTSEIGLGTGSIANATASVKYPPQQAFWAIITVTIDTLIICTLSGFVVLTSGVWTKTPSKEAPSMVIYAFQNVFGHTLSDWFISLLLFFFVIATLNVIIFYGEQQALILSGRKLQLTMRFIYLIAIVIGATGALTLLWKLLDLMIAVILVPNVLAILFLGKKVCELTDHYMEKRKKDSLEEAI
ncbi:alanine/glycine:cation symporter family protein [Shimazuella kribbensis]|uniref:alanine/glycine:cation symporter family protein n=1 Tax=Shimazuella kribbensis TaxID=139808 RepID=UPI000400F7BB|nr:amino acid carrier protein [Shimazuella kribbensis]